MSTLPANASVSVAMVAESMPRLCAASEKVWSTVALSVMRTGAGGSTGAGAALCRSETGGTSSRTVEEDERACSSELQITTEQIEPTAQARKTRPALPGKAVAGEKGIGGKLDGRPNAASPGTKRRGLDRGRRETLARYSICRENRRIVGENEAKRQADMKSGAMGSATMRGTFRSAETKRTFLNET
ncbi:hypothetical protein [Caballeronia sp. LZ035]|uniref:hypothetical protein n=1 Tax=Caballeronia sp. LZ035 TaxID=3038568 RepID=UPI0028609331|nr:hypothetical protein [Caballeronia sp. LZ035]MDR5760101.1 hypothetical protein [Caballeronia sp. LZ035]